jgi:transcriptional regulator GlxA family with amidase domain
MRNIGFVIFDNMEILDFSGPYDVFATASQLSKKACFNAFTISKDGKKIKEKFGLRIKPDFSFDNCPDIDILVIPGGPGTRSKITKNKFLKFISKKGKKAEIVFSVCTGALILAAAGLLKGCKAATHALSSGLLKEIEPDLEVVENKRYTDNGKIITSAGVTSGIDAALYLVKKLENKELAEKVANHIEYTSHQL